MKAMKKFLMMLMVMAGLALSPSLAHAQAQVTTGANVDNDLVVGFLMGFAENNTTSGGNFLSGLTSSALTGGVPMGGSGGIPGGLESVIGGSAAGGNMLGSAFGSVFNGTGVSSSNPTQSLMTGFLAGQVLAQTHNGLTAQGINLGDINLATPGFNGGASQNGVSSMVTALLGNNATTGAITDIMNGSFLGNSAGSALSGVQGAAVNGLIQSLGAGGQGSALGVLANLGLGTMGTQGGLESLGSLGGMAALGALNTQAGLGALGGNLGNISDLADVNSLLGQALQGQNNALLDTIMGSGVGGSSLTDLLSNAMGGGGMGGLLNNAEGMQGLLANAQGMLAGSTALISQMMSGDILGGALGNVLNNQLGALLGGGLGNILGGGLDGMLGGVASAITGATGALAAAMGGLSTAVSSAIGNLLGNSAIAGAVGNAIGNAVGNAIGDAVGGAIGGAAGSVVSSLLACGLPGSGGNYPTNPQNPGQPPGPNGDWCAAGVSGNSAGEKIASGAMGSIGASTANIAGTRGGALGCAIAVSRILECSCAPVGQHLSTVSLYNALENDPCYQKVDTGHINDADLQPGDVLVTKRGSRAGHTGIYVGNGNIVSNSSAGFQGNAPGTVQQNYSTDSWRSVTDRNESGSAVFRNICNC